MYGTRKMHQTQHNGIVRNVEKKKPHLKMVGSFEVTHNADTCAHIERVREP